MLPFLKKRQPSAVGVIVKHRAPDEKPEENQDDSQAAHNACAREIISAIEAKDESRLAEALKDIFNILDSEPHEEGPHTYDHQNEKAAEDQD